MISALASFTRAKYIVYTAHDDITISRQIYNNSLLYVRCTGQLSHIVIDWAGCFACNG